jgi:serine/threonine protein kinase
MKKPIVFGKYLLLERLNVGGMAEVFVAKAFGVEGFERILAIKKILPTMAEDEEFITMFMDEARISVQLNHANVVHVHELGKHGDTYYIAMEYVSGKDLRALLERFRRRKEIMPTAMAVFIASKICEGLDYAHRKKDARGQELHIIHRDVSPQNILLSYEGEVKIIDFGIAKAANRSQKTQAGILKGKFGYMSPEQVRGMPIDRRSDVFAVGVILFEMLTGEKLFVGESDFSTLEKVRNAEVPALRQFNPNIPAGLEKVVLKALAREVEDRYQWASDLQEDLMRFLLAGDTIYSSKHLAAFMKEAFAEDLLREAEKMERFASIERPEHLEPTGITAAPTKPPPRRPTAQPMPAVSQPPPPPPPRSRSSQAVAVASGAGAVATGMQANAAVDIPPPTEEELAEMDGSGDRTIIVDSLTDADPLKTAIGISPLVGRESEPTLSPRQTRPAPPPPLESKTQDNQEPTVAARSNSREALLDQTLPPQRNSLHEDTGAHDLRPIEMTGFRPALDVGDGGGQEHDTGEQPMLNPDETVLPRSGGRARIVIGDAPVGGATSIGPSPLADGEDLEAAEEEEYADEASEEGEYAEEEAYEEGQEGDLEEAFEEDHQALGEQETVPTDQQRALKARQPAQKDARSWRKTPAASDDKRRRILQIAIVATGVLALIVIGAAAVKVTSGSRSGVMVDSPQKIPFTVTVRPGDRVFNDSKKAIDLAPGDYTLDIRPTVQGYAPTKKPITVVEGKIVGVSVTFLKLPDANPEPPRPPDTKPPDVAVGPGATDTPPDSTPPDAVKPDAVKPRDVEPKWATYKALIDTDEPGVDIFVDGKKVGTTPAVSLEGLIPGRSYEGHAKKSGYETLNFKLENPEKKPLVELRLTMVKEARVESRPQPKVEPRPPSKGEAKVEPPPPRVQAKVEPPPPPKVEAKAEPKLPPPAPKSKAMGKLACTSNPVGAEIYVDGKNTGKKTPLPKSQALELPVGMHKVHFKFAGKASPPQVVEIKEGDVAIVKQDL